MTRLIVRDTGPLLHLSEAGAAHLLSLAGKVLISPLVAAEFVANSQGWNPPQWIQVVALEKSSQRKAERWMSTEHIHSGEAEAIGLALQEHADWLLTDDAIARQFAESLGLEVHGSIAILLWSMAKGIVPEKELAVQLMDRLAKTSLWISDRVLQEAYKAIDTLFE